MNIDAQLEILYKDNAIIVVNKPGGLLAVPGKGPEKQDCIVRRLRTLQPDCIKQPAVHRLDMATSGLMVLALTSHAHRELSAQFACRKITKRYVAVLEGEVSGDSGEICLAFRLDPQSRPYQIYDPVHGKPGITLWKKLYYSNHQTIMEFFPKTGRTHQLRLHASHPKGLGCPVVGDSLYGNGNKGDRMLLHASGLQFTHPETQKELCFFAPPSFLHPNP